MRITRQHLQAKVDIINGMLGYESPEYNTVGSIQLYQTYGATVVHRVVNESHGVTDLSGLGTMREASQFLSGMIAALRISQEVTR